MLDPFDLFCAYHLGLDGAGRVRFANIHDVARRFATGVDVVEAALESYGMDAARMLEIDFDLAAAQHDIQVSPPGVDLPSIARMHFDLFLAARERPRDWDKELAADAAANAETFGGRGPRR